MHQLPEVLTVFHVTGADDLLVHVAVRDIQHLRDLIVDRVAARAEVANCETAVIYSLFRNAKLPRYRGEASSSGPAAPGTSAPPAAPAARRRPSRRS